jgi:uncharacterized protein DUF6056
MCFKGKYINFYLFCFLNLIFIEMKKLNKTHFFLVGLLLAFLPYFYLCFFANPSADDFSLSGQAMQNDFLHLMYHNYFFWNGRYISNIFIYLNPLVFGSFGAYKMVPFLIIILLVIVNYCFINQLFDKQTKQLKIIIAFILSLLFIHNMPIISEGIYWFTGAVIYLLGIIFVLFYFSYLIRIFRKTHTIISQLFLTLLLLVSCGFNEVLTLLIVFFLAIVSLTFHIKKLPKRNIIITQFLFSCFFASLMIFSPGNEYRQVAYDNAHNFSYSLIYSVLQVGRFSLKWLFSIPLVAASILYLEFNKNMRKENSLFSNSFYINRWVSLLLLFVIIFICVFPAYWATGILGQHRTLNVAYFFFLIIWFVSLTAWYNHYQKELKFSFKKKTKIILMSFLFVGIIFTGNGYVSLFDVFSGSANNYNKQMTNRFERLKAQKNIKGEIIVFPIINNPPKSLFTSEITNNPKEWTNQAYNLYFDIDKKNIVLEQNELD